MLTSAYPTAACAGGSTVTYGAELRFDTLVAEHDQEPVRRPCEDTLLRVISGIVRLTVDGEERLLLIGDEAVVPAGAAHRVASADGAARIVTGFRRAA